MQESNCIIEGYLLLKAEVTGEGTERTVISEAVLTLRIRAENQWRREEKRQIGEKGCSNGWQEI